MRLITVSGPPASGKTAVILKTLAALPQLRAGVVKFDCLSTFDDDKYRAAGYPAALGISGSLCPDHYYVSNIQDSLSWGRSQGLDLLVCESAGLCNRCSPHIQAVLAVCVVDLLGGIDTPRKIGPMLKLADVVVITKGDVVSQAEREVFAMRVAEANPEARILLLNGLSGQGAAALAALFLEAAQPERLTGCKLRFSMPAAMCTFCYGNREIAKGYRTGLVRGLEFSPRPQPPPAVSAESEDFAPDCDFSHIPLCRLLARFPQIEALLRSYNLKELRFDYSLAQLLASFTYTDFQDSGMDEAGLLRQFNLLLRRLLTLEQRPRPRLNSLTVLGGRDKDGQPESLELTLRPGQVLALVGPTGSGKSRLLEDVEYLADGDTLTGRRIRIDGAAAGSAWRYQAENLLVAQLSQSMSFVMDLTVGDFLRLHAACRGQGPGRVGEVLAAANKLCGEGFSAHFALTQLSGGQSRALMIADLALLSAAPVVLIDEIENAGVDKRAALALLSGAEKIVLVSTHDPLLALLADSRLVIANGAVRQVRATSAEEKRSLEQLSRYDQQLSLLREQLRQGQELSRFAVGS